MQNKNPNKKIYGYDEALWYRTIKEGWKSGDRDAWYIAALLRQHNAGKYLLDLGCGVGRISTRLAVMGYSVVGIDLSERCVAEARRLARELRVEGKTRYVTGNYTELERYVSEPFDAALCILAPSWNNAEEIAGFFSKLKRFMKPASVLIIRDTLREPFLQSLYASPTVQNWYKIEGGILSLHSWSYNPETSEVRTNKGFYRKTTGGFRFISEVSRDYYLIPLSEYVAALKKAGWDIMRAEKPGTVDMLRAEEYNDPWLLTSSTIVARPVLGGLPG